MVRFRACVLRKLPVRFLGGLVKKSDGPLKGVSSTSVSTTPCAPGTYPRTSSAIKGAWTLAHTVASLGLEIFVEIDRSERSCQIVPRCTIPPQVPLGQSERF